MSDRGVAASVSQEGVDDWGKVPSFWVCATALSKFTGKKRKLLIGLAPRDGFEPPTNGLTVRRSTTELPGNTEEARIVGKQRREVKESHECDDGVGHVGCFQLRDF